VSERFIVYGFPGAYPRVFDTTEPVMIDGVHQEDTEGFKLYTTFCDSYSMENAEMICAALNRYVEDQKK
jgi:hypothetical protein